MEKAILFCGYERKRVLIEWLTRGGVNRGARIGALRQAKCNSVLVHAVSCCAHEAPADAELGNSPSASGARAA